MNDYTKYSQLVFDIIGSAMAVHKELRWGLHEAIYNEALSLELDNRGIIGLAEQPIHCYYKGQLLEKQYRADLIVGDILVELKSCKEIIPQHRSQLFNYLRLTKLPIGLLLNFSEKGLTGERYGYDATSNKCHLLDRNLVIVPSETP